MSKRDSTKHPHAASTLLHQRTCMSGCLLIPLVISCVIPFINVLQSVCSTTLSLSLTPDRITMWWCVRVWTWPTLRYRDYIHQWRTENRKHVRCVCWSWEGGRWRGRLWWWWWVVTVWLCEPPVNINTDTPLSQSPALLGTTSRCVISVTLQLLSDVRLSPTLGWSFIGFSCWRAVQGAESCLCRNVHVKLGGNSSE